MVDSYPTRIIPAHLSACKWHQGLFTGLHSPLQVRRDVVSSPKQTVNQGIHPMGRAVQFVDIHIRIGHQLKYSVGSIRDLPAYGVLCF